MFDSHPDMAVPPETHALSWLGRNRGRYEGETGLDVERLRTFATKVWTTRWRLPDEEFPADLFTRIGTVPEAARVLFSAYADRYGKCRYAEKTPVNVLHIPSLSDLFPESRFIHIVRDGRDVALSYLSVDFGVTSVAEAAIQWKRSVEQGRNDGVELGTDRYREVRYEDLVEAAEPTLRELCRFIDLPFDPSMLRYFERAEGLRSAIHATAHRRLSEPPGKGRDWREEMELRDLMLFEAIAGSTLERFGYPRAIDRLPTSTHVRAAIDAVAVNAERFRRATAKRYRAAKKRRNRKVASS